MHIVVKSITDLKTPQICHGKSLARLARECFANQQTLTVDFDGVATISQGFFQALFLPLLAEYGADHLKQYLKIVNVCPGLNTTIQSELANLGGYFEQRMKIHDKECDADLYQINLTWLIKARELVSIDSAMAELVMGIGDDEMHCLLGQLTLDDIQHIAQSGWLCFAPRFSPAFIKSFMANSAEPIDVLLALNGSVP